MSLLIDIHSKDAIKLNILQDVLSKKAFLKMRINDELEQDYRDDVHQEGSRVQVFGKYNISEDPAGEILTIRPMILENTLSVKIVSNGNSEASLSVVRSATKSVEQEVSLAEGETSFVIKPNGTEFILEVLEKNNDTETIEEIIAESDTSDNNQINNCVVSNSIEKASSPEIEKAKENLEQQNKELQYVKDSVADITLKQSKIEEEKKEALNQLDMMQLEYQKDLSGMKEEVEEYKARLDVDVTVLQYYKDKDFQPVEKMIEEVKEKLDAIEQQIKLFVEAKQTKTMEIENEIKSNKR